MSRRRAKAAMATARGRGDRIVLEVLGDSGLFSPRGKGFCYLVSAGRTRLLLECGSSPFARLGERGVAGLSGVIVTHAHLDHHRYLTDLALYYRYVLGRSLPVLATEAVAEDLVDSWTPALVRSLTDDHRQVLDVPFGKFVRSVRLGPRPRYALRPVARGGRMGWRAVETATGRVAEARRAKAVVGPEGTRPHLLVFDRACGEWVEPEDFYAFGERAFYPGPDRAWRCRRSGLTVRALKAPAWHGVRSAAIVLERGGARAVFSGDTVYDPELWRRLAETKRRQRLPASRRGFLAARELRADINDLIERVWSRRRLAEALAAYDGAVVFHDSDHPGCAVHTPYGKLAAAAAGPEGSRWKGLVLTHTPERFTALHPIACPGRRFAVTASGLAGLDGRAVAWHKEGERVWALRPSRRGDLAVRRSARGLKLVRGKGPGYNLKMYPEE